MRSLPRLACLAIFLVLAGCNTAPTSTPTPAALPAPPDLVAAQVTLGAAVYAAHCAECHGANLEGEAEWKTQNDDGSFRAPPHSAAGHTWHHADSVLLEAIREGGARFDGENIGGTSDMPVFGDTLGEEEISAVLTFIKSTWPADVRALQWAQTLQDQASATFEN